MFECFLLLRHAGDKWIAFIAIPAVIAGLAASICLMITGLKGCLAGSIRHTPRFPRTAPPDRVVQWLSQRPPSNREHVSNGAAARHD